VWIGKTNESEPLMKCRKRKVTSKPGGSRYPGISAGATCLLPAWRPALRWRQSGIRHAHGTWEPVASMRRERSKWKPHKDLSTDARHRGGMARSSCEGRVMRLEPRGHVTQVLTVGQP